MKNVTRIRILLADDHFVVREGLRSIIRREADMVVAGEAANGMEALRAFDELKPDVVVMDMRMPIHDGVEAARVILGQDPEARIVMLSSYENEEDIHAAIEAGAMSYILKHDSREIVPAIRAVMNGQRWIPKAIAEALASRDRGHPLTPREREIVQLIARGQANKQIADVLNITEGTVKTHMTSILSKLQAPDRAGAVVECIRRGIIHLPEH